MRLDRYIADCTGSSRKGVQRLIKSGRIIINGELAKEGKRQIEPSDAVSLDEQILALPQHIYIMLNKPQGYICANQDALHPTAMDLIDFTQFNLLRNAQVQICGRLDIDTTGLVLITTDGDWNHRISAASSHCKKLYLVDLAEPLAIEAKLKLETGIQLKSEEKPTRPAELNQISATQCEIWLTEGKYHQVKRMFAACSNRVTKLHRQQIGDISLDPNLKLGAWRHLTPEEVQSV